MNQQKLCPVLKQQQQQKQHQITKQSIHSYTKLTQEEFTNQVKSIINEVIKSQQYLCHNVYKQQVPEEFPILSIEDSTNYDIILISKILSKQNYALAEKCSELKEKLDSEFQSTMNDKKAADNNKNLKSENDYLNKQVQILRREVEKMQTFQRDEEKSEKDKDIIRNQQSTNYELKIKLKQSEEDQKQLSSNVEKLKNEIEKAKNARAQEVEMMKKDNKKLKNIMYQDDNYVQQKIYSELEKVSEKAQLQINVHSQQAYQIFNSNTQDQFSKDLICQQLSVAHLNEEILVEWKKNQKKYKNLDQILIEHNDLKYKCNSLIKEGSGLKLELAELQQAYDQIEHKFSIIMDKFQDYIYNYDCSDGGQEEINIQCEKKELGNSFRDTQSLSQLVTQREKGFSLLNFSNIEQENIQNIKQYNQVANGQQYILNKDLSFTQNILNSTNTRLQDLMNDSYNRNTVSENSFQNLQAIFAIIYGISLKLQRGMESCQDLNIQNYQQLNTQRLIQTIHKFSVSIDSMIDTIVQNIDEQVQIIEFKDLSEKVLQQFEDNNQDPQFFYDLMSLYQNLLKQCLNKEIETSLLKRNLDNIITELQQQCNGAIDLNSLIRQNLNEILELKIENQSLAQQLDEIQRQMDQKHQTLSEIQCQILKNQSLSGTYQEYTMANTKQMFNNSISAILGNRGSKTFDTTLLGLNNFNQQNNQCESCVEVKLLYAELDKYVNECKSKIDSSTDIIKKLEFSNQQNAQDLGLILSIIAELASMFEKKEINPNHYPVKVLAEFVRDKVKRLFNKNEDLKLSNDKFQSLVLQELEALNHQIALKKQHKKQQKENIKSDRNTQQMKPDNQQLHENQEMFDQFMNLFGMLKDKISKQADIEDIKVLNYQSEQLNNRVVPIKNNIDEINIDVNGVNLQQQVFPNSQHFLLSSQSVKNNMPQKVLICKKRTPSCSSKNGNELTERTRYMDNNLGENQSYQLLSQTELNDRSSQRAFEVANRQQRLQLLVNHQSSIFDSSQQLLSNSSQSEQKIFQGYQPTFGRADKIQVSSNAPIHKNYSESQYYQQQVQQKENISPRKQRNSSKSPKVVLIPTQRENILQREQLDSFYERVSSQIQSQRCKSAELNKKHQQTQSCQNSSLVNYQSIQNSIANNSISTSANNNQNQKTQIQTHHKKTISQDKNANLRNTVKIYSQVLSSNKGSSIRDEMNRTTHIQHASLFNQSLRDSRKHSPKRGSTQGGRASHSPIGTTALEQRLNRNKKTFQ